MRTQYIEGIYRHNYPVTLKSRLRVSIYCAACSTGWANTVSFVVVKHVIENFDNFWQVK